MHRVISLRGVNGITPCIRILVTSSTSVTHGLLECPTCMLGALDQLLVQETQYVKFSPQMKVRPTISPTPKCRIGHRDVCTIFSAMCSLPFLSSIGSNPSFFLDEEVDGKLVSIDFLNDPFSHLSGTVRDGGKLRLDCIMDPNGDGRPPIKDTKV